MSDLEYYESMKYQEFLVSSKRKEICEPSVIFESFKIDKVRNLVDFGIGLGFFIPYYFKYLPKDAWVWGIDYQQDLLDLLLQKKINDEIERFTPFYLDKSDHPILPEWTPTPDCIFSSMCLSTFVDPGLAMDGLIRSMKQGGRLIIVDWIKTEFTHGPPIKDKISFDKMKFLAEDYKLDIVKTLRVSEFVYALEVVANKEFVYGIYEMRD